MKISRKSFLGMALGALGIRKAAETGAAPLIDTENTVADDLAKQRQIAVDEFLTEKTINHFPAVPPVRGDIWMSTAINEKSTYITTKYLIWDGSSWKPIDFRKPISKWV